MCKGEQNRREERAVPYEIRVVFQTEEAYQSAVDRLYAVFGAALPPLEPSNNGQSGPPPSHIGVRDDVSDRDLSEDPVLAPDLLTFVVEDRTR
jgi:hypothetical protein